MTSDRVVVVTGAGRGIGAAIAARFADEGATVVAADVELPVGGDPRIDYQRVDVSSAGDVAGLFSRVIASHGRVDVLVNNAGIWFRRRFMEISVDEWDRVLAVNLRGLFLCTKAAVDSMAAAGGGAIINIGSQAGLTVTRGQGAHYHASKAAIAHLTKVLAFELGPMGIRVNCVAPGATLPDPSVLPPELLAQIPLGRAGVPADLVGACMFLASSDASYITGQTLMVNGGAVAFM
ncbi:SDR family NAD(P)-dependent oxidoreductase [Mycobacterium sp.]|uniref:SDR family NAD(P)-dependent oxidoreductase n=1 Tax=Mycobacterium sp. TaxID=1785 RepID=UPI003C77A254